MYGSYPKKVLGRSFHRRCASARDEKEVQHASDRRVKISQRCEIYGNES